MRNSTIGTLKRNFFAGVYCAPLSICSHIFKLSYAPELNSKGTPRTQWNMRNEPNMYEILVKVHEVSWDMPGTISKRTFKVAMRTKWIDHAPRFLISAPQKYNESSYHQMSNITHLLRWPNLHSSLVKQLDHSYVLQSLVAQCKADC